MTKYKAVLRSLATATVVAGLLACQAAGGGRSPAPVASAASEPGSPREQASALARRVVALYDQADFDGIMQLSTPSLRSLFVQAIDANRRYERAHPDEKPPMGDGELVMLFGLADATTPGNVSVRSIGPLRAQVDVMRSVDGGPSRPDATIQLILQRQADGEWRLDDVVHGDGQRLRDGLQAVIAP